MGPDNLTVSCSSALCKLGNFEERIRRKQGVQHIDRKVLPYGVRRQQYLYDQDAQGGRTNGSSNSVFKHGGKRLFQEPITYGDVVSLIASGGAIKTKPLTDNFSYDDFLKLPEEKRIPLFAIDAGGNIHPLSFQSDFSPKADWKIIGLSFDYSFDGKH